MAPGDYVTGVFLPGVFCNGGVFTGGIFTGVFLPRVFCPGYYYLEPLPIYTECIKKTLSREFVAFSILLDQLLNTLFLKIMNRAIFW